MMTFIGGLIVGLFIGWIIEWVIDWLFWRQDDQKLSQELAQAEVQKRLLQTRLEEAEATIQQLRAELDQTSRQASLPADKLERINGIGAVFAQRLHEAGIHSFAQLAASTPQQVTEIIRPESWQKIEPEEWIEEARQLAGQKAEGS